MTTHATINGVDASRSTALHHAGCRRAADDESGAVGDLLAREHRVRLADLGRTCDGDSPVLGHDRICINPASLAKEA